MTAFIKGWVVALFRAWQSWQWVTLLRRGFAPCSIISHYYMSHLLPRIPMGEHTQTLTYAHTGSHTFRWCHAHLATIMPKTQQYALAPGQKSFLSQQPSPAFTTTRLLKSKKKKKIPKWHWFNCVPHNTASYSGSLRKHSSSFATLQNSRQKKKKTKSPRGHVTAKTHGTWRQKLAFMCLFIYAFHLRMFERLD